VGAGCAASPPAHLAQLTSAHLQQRTRNRAWRRFELLPIVQPPASGGEAPRGRDKCKKGGASVRLCQHRKGSRA
jgi:hypothetical protein